MSESQEQIALFKFLSLHEARHPVLKWVHASMTGASASSKAAAGLRKAQGQKKGIFDICVPIPMKGLHGFWIEMKVKPNKLTHEQKEFYEYVTANDYAAAVCYSWSEAAFEIFDYLGIKVRIV